jgi:flagellin
MRFDARLLRINGARSNLNNAISFNQTQDGFMKKVAKALDRMSELSILAQDVTKTTADCALYDKEFQALGTYISDLTTKDFNGVSLFDGADLAVTSDADGGATFTNVGVDLVTATSAAVASAVTDATAAATAFGSVKDSIDLLAESRAAVGANISVMQSYNEQLGVLSDNITNANSRIKDVDVAEESTQFARYNILVQAGTAMLAQANQSPQSVLRLLQ